MEAGESVGSCNCASIWLRTLSSNVMLMALHARSRLARSGLSAARNRCTVISPIRKHVALIQQRQALDQRLQILDEQAGSGRAQYRCMGGCRIDPAQHVARENHLQGAGVDQFGLQLPPHVIDAHLAWGHGETAGSSAAPDAGPTGGDGDMIDPVALDLLALSR